MHYNPVLMKRLLLLLFSGLLLGAVTAGAQSTGSNASLNGAWDWQQPQPSSVVLHNYVILHQNGRSVTGTIVFRSANERTIPALQWQGDAVVADLGRGGEYRIRRQGANLDIVMTRGNHREEVTATPVPMSQAEAPAPLPLPVLKALPANGLALTPPMGWNSWNYFRDKVDDATVRQIADAMVASGMRDAGYKYINIDDTWEGSRDAQGNIVPNKKFPDMKALADYVHSKGLKLGIYSSPGPYTCAGYLGSYGHEVQDANTYAKWGIDYLKYDWCSARRIYSDADLRAVYQKMGQALEHSGRPIVFSLCEYGRGDVWTWGPKVAGNLWRTTGDISDHWDRMSKIGFDQSRLAPWAGPGHWNDPDMLEVGNGHMSVEEYRTHFSLWCLLAAPLIAGNDLRHMTPGIRDILTNREALAVDQDKLGKQGQRVAQDGTSEIWAKPLAGGALAVGLFNRGEQPATIQVSWSQLGLSAQPHHLRDLWAHKDLAVSGAGYSVQVPAHGVALLRVTR